MNAIEGVMFRSVPAWRTPSRELPADAADAAIAEIAAFRRSAVPDIVAPPDVILALAGRVLGPDALAQLEADVEALR